ncbi:MAG: Fic/DOC family N-terminal domain-containing protein [Gelidibacter sp.]
MPYNNLPIPPPQKEIESTTILKKTITASRALSGLKGAIANLPNPILFIDAINLQEARASSAIENIITTQDELFKASIADKKNDNPATKEVTHYKDALWFGFEEIKRKPMLTTNLFIAIM